MVRAGDRAGRILCRPAAPETDILTQSLHTLPNGVRVVCDPIPGLETVAVCVAIGAGARHESPEHSGWSHFLEHMVFKGAGDMSARDIVERIEAGGGSINASTGYERTVFEVRAMADGLETALQVIADLIFHPVFEPEEVEREKDVVAQEIAEAFDTPDDHVFEMAQAQAFHDQPLGRAILGQVETLAPIDREALKQFRTDMYRPERIVVSVSGAVDEAHLLTLVERGFGEGVARPTTPVSAGLFNGGEARLARRIEQSNLVFLLPGLSHTDPRRPALRLGVEILGGGMASRLFQTAREERGLAYAVDAYHESYADCGLLGLYAGSAADRAAELAQVCGDTIRALVDDGPTQRELDRARAVARAGIRMADESPVARAGRLATQSLIFGKPVGSDQMVQEVMCQERADVQSALAACLEPRLAATAVLGPRAGLSAGLLFERALTG
jgi:predicted Zn-dependent peptidase